MEKVKIGVFGCGRGRDMIEQIIQHPDAELVAVCDRSGPALDWVRDWVAGFGLAVKGYTSFDEFLTCGMDAVVLANYATEHAVYAAKCLRAGKHVMSEVLPAETPAQMVELIEAVEASGRIYTYAENYCYRPATLEMWKRYQNGEIGEIMYGEGEYLHDCSSAWPEISHGEKDHWRNRIPSTFYCTHSCGPLLTITGLRPVTVVGFETPLSENEREQRIGFHGRSGIEMITLENGAVLKSIHGALKREPGSVNYQIYGSTGMMESERYNDGDFNLYREGPKLCQGTWENYTPDSEVGKALRGAGGGHGGSDFYPTYCFIEKILGRPDGRWAVDVYTACDMGLCGLMAHRSILDGNRSKEIPDLRIPAVRDRYRFDNACTTPAVAGDQLLPTSPTAIPETPDEVFAAVRKQWRGEASGIEDLF